MQSIVDFLKRPVIQLDGIKVTVLLIVLVILAYLLWRKYGKR